MIGEMKRRTFAATGNGLSAGLLISANRGRTGDHPLKRIVRYGQVVLARADEVIE